MFNNNITESLIFIDIPSLVGFAVVTDLHPTPIHVRAGINVSTHFQTCSDGDILTCIYIALIGDWFE